MNDPATSWEPARSDVSPPRAVWWAAIGVMAVLATLWLGYQTYRYFGDPGAVGSRAVSAGAIDLQNRFLETRSWFRGEYVYRMYKDAVYAPASYAIFGLFFPWLPWEVVKPAWYVLSVGALAWLARQFVRHGNASRRWERAFLGLMPFAFSATGAALGNGQVVILVMAALFGSLIVLERRPTSRRRLWTGAALMLLALVQPTIAAPFFWLVMFRSGRLPAATLVLVGYVLLTVGAVSWQMRSLPNGEGEARPVQLLGKWSQRAQGGAYYGSVKGGYGTVHDALAACGKRQWNLPASLVVLGLLGIWIHRQRAADIWLLLGVTAIVARVWVYHRWYDDLLLAFPLIALFRVTGMPATGRTVRCFAAVLFVWLWGFLLAPGVLYTLPDPSLLVGIQVTGWLAALVFLAGVTEAAGPGTAAPS